MTITGGLILFTLTYVGWRKYKGEREKEKVMSILRIDNVINKDTDCKFYSLTMVAEENRMRSTILKTSMEVQRFMMFYLIYFASFRSYRCMHSQKYVVPIASIHKFIQHRV